MFRQIQDPQEIQSVYPLMKQLRENLNLADFLERTQAAIQESRYQFWGYFQEGQCQGLMGLRVLTDLVHGRHLYIDDLVIDQSLRSKGLGSAFLKQAKKIAQSENCRRLRLCTGIDNDRGKEFYARNGWKLRAVVYKSDLS